MQQNATAAGAPSRTPLEELTALPQTPSLASREVVGERGGDERGREERRSEGRRRRGEGREGKLEQG